MPQLNYFAKTAKVHPEAEIGVGNWFGENVVVEKGVVIGDHNYFDRGAIIGAMPEIRKSLLPEVTGGLEIGDHNVFREYSLVQMGSTEKTLVGDKNFIQARVTVAHDCKIAHHVTVSANSVIAGHVIIHTHSTIGANSSVHQKSEIGFGVMVGMNTVIRGKAFNFQSLNGNPAKTLGPNRKLLDELLENWESLEEIFTELGTPDIRRPLSPRLEKKARMDHLFFSK